MRYLLGLIGKNNKDEIQFHSCLKALLKASASEITEAHSASSVLSYLAIDDYDAIWIRWPLLKNLYTNFCHRLEVINKKVPLIIMYNDKQISGEICLGNNMVFSLIHEKQLKETVPILINRIHQFNQFKKINDHHQKKDIRPNGYRKFVGNDESMLKLYSQIIKVAKTDFSVLILGQSGSGKEIVAKSIHRLSHRNKSPFISLNYAAIPENLLESELFGYEKGAFTGAQKAKEGKFELANNGTIFLDEIGDLALPLQGKLLRVLEDHTIERLGGTTTKKVDIRLLAATNKDLNQLTEEGKFRADLFHRLNVIPIKLLPIRERGDDITLLVLHLIASLTKNAELKIKSISYELIEKLKSFPLNGNVRELENILTRLIFYSETLDLSEDDLDEISTIDVVENESSDTVDLKINPKIVPLRDVEKQAISDALNKLDRHITNVADALEISRGTLYNKIKEYNL
ncbi:MAG: sigma-54-dependent Fis family transcriptional regulator [Candidatus Marinimicrobia bacterium]|nr:sigma-54-dependent Fis family transcriptional regulator [Candidatus Neomarinimicrobiota bacterium]